MMEQNKNIIEHDDLMIFWQHLCYRGMEYLMKLKLKMQYPFGTHGASGCCLSEEMRTKMMTNNFGTWGWSKYWIEFVLST